MKLAQRIRCVEPSPPRRIFDLAAQYSNVIDLTLGDPDIPPPLIVRQAGCSAIMAGRTRYSANAGLPELRQAIAEDVLRTTYVPADPGREIIVTVGAMEAAFLTLYALVEPGSEVIIHAPYWINYAQVVRSLGGVPVFVYTRSDDHFTLHASEVEKLITPRTSILILNSPNNPSGAIIPRAELQQLAKLACKHDLVVISDEIYRTLIYDNAPYCSIRTLPGMLERTVTIDGLSKRAAMTGWRLGWAIGPEFLIREMVKMQENIVACAPLPAQYAAIAALNNSAVSEVIRQEFQHRRDIVCAELSHANGLYCHPVAATFYALLDISGTGMSAEDFVIHLLEKKHVATIHGSAYGGETYNNLIRIAFTLEEKKLRLGLNRLKQFALEKYKEHYK